MTRVRVFLSTPLYTVRGEEHVPSDAVIMDGRVTDRVGGGVIVAVESYSDGYGRPLEGAARNLYLPASKIDHIQLMDET